MISQGSHGTTAPLAPCEPRRVTTPISQSSEQGTLPTASLISKRAVPYWTRCGTCCHGVSTVMIRFFTDLRMTNHITWRIPTSFHHSKPCSKHSIEPHHSHLTSRRMDDQHSQHSTQVKLNIIKMKRLVRWLKTPGQSNATNHKNSILKYEGLCNQLMHVTSVY
jgi:hypothetical protein